MRSPSLVFAALACFICAAAATHEFINVTAGAVTFKGNLTFDMAIDAQQFQYIFAADKANATGYEAIEPLAYQMRAALYPAGFINASNPGLGADGRIAANASSQLLGVALFECALVDKDFRLGVIASSAIASCTGTWFLIPQNEDARVYVLGANYTFAGEPNSTVPALSIREPSKLFSRAMIAASVLPGGATIVSSGMWASPRVGSLGLDEQFAFTRALTGGSGAYLDLTGECAIEQLDNRNAGVVDAVLVRLAATDAAAK